MQAVSPARRRARAAAQTPSEAEDDQMGDEEGDPGSNDPSQAGDGDEPRSGPFALT